MKYYKLTILTPTYNRGELLKKLYQSLLIQTYKNFEWVIIDDGSTDDTEKIVSELKKEGYLPIKYKKKENGGKPSAHNEGVMLASSDLTVICDDDDYFIEGALSSIIETWESACKKGIIGMIGYRGTAGGEPLGGHIFPDKQYAHIEEIFPFDQYFDTTQIYRTDILRSKLFPISFGEKFIPEVWLWKELDKMGKLVIIPKVLEVCVYREDGLTKTNSQTMWNNPKGFALYFKQRYEEARGFKRIKYYNIYKGLSVSTNSEYKNKKIYSLMGFPFFFYVVCKACYLRRKK